MSESVRKMKDRASRYYSQGRLRDALMSYRQVVEEDPTELQCQLKIGDLYRRLGENDEAVVAYLPVARHYAADGLLLKSIAVCKMILGLKPDHSETQSLLAELHAKRRAPSQVGPPVTLRGMGISPPPGGMVVVPPMTGYNMIEFDDDGQGSGLELDREAGATGSVRRKGPTERMWSTPVDDAWTNDLPSKIDPETLVGGEDSFIEVTEMPRVDTGAAPPAVDPKLVKGSPLTDGDTDDDIIDADEPLTLGEVLHEALDEASAARKAADPAGAVTAAWPTTSPATASGPPPAWPVSAPVNGVDDHEEEIGEELAEVQIPLFSELPRNAFVDLLVRMGLREVEPGDVIIREGDVGDAFYVVASGKVRVSRRGTDGREIPLAYLTDGAFFGEMAVLQNGARTATVTAEEPSQIFEIRREVLDDVVEAYPSVAKVLRNFYRQRLLSTTMATHPVFMPFNPEERRGLMEMFKSRQVKAGDVLLEQGKKGSGLFILLHGQLEVVRLGQDGQAVTLAHLIAGDMFGEMSLLTNEPTVARVLAVSDCFVLRLSKRKFDEVIMTHPQVLALVSEVSQARTSINDALLGAQQSLTGGTVLV